MNAHVFAPFAGIGVVLLLTVIPWHFRAKNTAVILLSTWLGLTAICLFVNSILWWDNVDIKAQVWCDISTKIIYLGQIGPACCCLCVLRRLEHIASTRVVQSSARDQRKQLVIDLSIGLGIPVVFTALHIVNQGHRFDIVQGVGCVPTIYWTPVAVALNLVPPLLVSFTAMIYGLLALRWFTIRRQQFKAVLQSNCSHIDRNRYVRLMIMACTEAIIAFPINLATFINKFEYQKQLNPWISWDDTHYNFGYIGLFPATYFPLSDDGRRLWQTLELGRWGIVIGCWLIFCFFGTSKEATQVYVTIPKVLYTRWCGARRRSLQPTSPTIQVQSQTAWRVDPECPAVKDDSSNIDLAESKSTISKR